MFFYLNGLPQTLQFILSGGNLLDFLRNDARLTGTKLACGEGGCGACTVLVSRFNRSTQSLKHSVVNACITPICFVDGCHVVTVEGLGSTKSGLHPVQKRIAELHGSQCGFCTPGIVMRLYAFLLNRPNATKLEIENCMDGNLCRCTGYRPILDAARSFARDSEADTCPCPEVGSSCARTNSCARSDIEDVGEMIGETEGSTVFSVANTERTPDRIVKKSCSCDKESEFKHMLIEPLEFPKELYDYEPKSLIMSGEGITWYRPLTLQEVLELTSKNPSAKLISGNTSVALDAKRQTPEPVTDFITLDAVAGLKKITTNQECFQIGACVSVSDLLIFCENFVSSNSPDFLGVAACSLIAQSARSFGSSQIRNMARVGGSVVARESTADLNIVWQCLDASFLLLHMDSGGHTQSRTVRACEYFCAENPLKPSEVLTDVVVPRGRAMQFSRMYKQAKRRTNAKAICNAAVSVVFGKPEDKSLMISDFRLAVGGVKTTTFDATEFCNFLIGEEWTLDTINKARKRVVTSVFADSPNRFGMDNYRKSLISGYISKFFIDISAQLRSRNLISEASESESKKYDASRFVRPISHGQQEFQVSSDQQVGLPVMHAAAALQATGEATFTADMEMPSSGLHGAFLLSDRPRATIISIDVSQVIASYGVVAYFSAKDLNKDTNKVGHDTTPQEELFCSGEVFHVGQIIGMVVADTHAHARAASEKARLVYKEHPAVLTINEARKSIDSNTTGCPLHVNQGDVDLAMRNATVIEGVMRVGGQEHFYLETQTSLAIPDESGGVSVWSSSQNPHSVQEDVARVLGVPFHNVTVHVKRLGGAFGGKESRAKPFASAAAFAAQSLNRPVRVVLDRDVDMKISGKRAPFLGEYKVGFTAEGRIVALDLKVFSNGGYYEDHSFMVMASCLVQITNTYNIENLRVVGRVCRTNLPPTTAFRGFGRPQGMMICESILDKVACFLKKDPSEIRELNMYKPGDSLPCGLVMPTHPIRSMWNALRLSCSYESRRAHAAEFNRTNTRRKRGVAMVPTQFGIGFPVKFLNIGTALVHVYVDGSVLVTHGGCEMGQGLHTKMIQIAATALNIPVSKVHVSETATDKVNNMPPTAASFSSDLNGMAVLNACSKINARLEVLRNANPGITWEQLVSKAYMDAVDLCAHGYHKTSPDSNYDLVNGKGRFFNYHTFGVACTEVELDVLSGDFHILRVDILMDVGKSLNPAIDIGQVEGAFMQGVGLFCSEEVIWGDDSHSWMKQGHLFTSSPDSYKIPAANDIPLDFRISFLENSENKFAVHSSKGVGEPPLFLGSSVFFALKEAIMSARKDAGLEGYFQLDSPATCEKVRLAYPGQLS
eukprot:186450_1